MTAKMIQTKYNFTNRLLEQHVLNIIDSVEKLVKQVLLKDLRFSGDRIKITLARNYGLINGTMRNNFEIN